MIQTQNPFNYKVIQSFQALKEKEVDQKLKNAENTFQEWQQVSFQERADLMRKIAQLLRADAERLGAIITLEMGKVIKEAKGEVEKCAWVCEYYAENAERFLLDEIIDAGEGQSFITYQPLGTVFAIMPWNFPFWQVFRYAAPTLMAGNVCVLKHAPNVPQCALAIEELFLKAGFPVGAFQSLLIEVDLVEQIIAHPSVQAVTLTGSERAGASVASLAGKYIKKSVLELGGSDPYIVLPDADLERAVPTAVKSRMLNTGQSCIAAKRFLVHEDIAEDFTEKMRAEMENLQLGDPSKIESDYAVLARQDLVDGLDNQVQASISKGAKVVLGGNRGENTGAFYQATILKDIPMNAPAFSEELFGPVASIFTFTTEEEVLNIANGSDYGLGASIWSQDLERATNLARKVQSGAVFVNDMTKSDPRLPFGGIKKSGYGRELSYLGIREFTNIQTIWVKP